MKSFPNRKRDIGSYEREFIPEYIRSRLDYDAASGSFTWLPDDTKLPVWNIRFAGARAGCRAGRYIKININTRPLMAHRLAWIHVHGQIPRHMRIDHINGDGTDNRLANLRLATQSENQINWTRLNPNGRPRGVYWYPPHQKYVARIVLRGRVKTFGYHETVEGAERAYQEGMNKLCGEFSPFANLG